MDRKIIMYSIFDDYKELKAFTTYRNTDPRNELNRYTGTNGDFMKYRQLLSSDTGIKPSQWVFPVQTHSSNVKIIKNGWAENLEDTDALVTNIPNLCLCVQTADCVPVLLFDTVKKVVAAAHAGWRGTVNHIVTKLIEQMVDVYGTKPQDILAVIGPSIGPDHYQVGEEVADVAYRSVPRPELSIHADADGKISFNLWEANRQILINCGLPETNIELSGLCTFKYHKMFYSARREGITTGRMVSGIMLLN